MMTTTLTRKHQVTLPPEIVQALDLTPGMQLDWTVGPDGTLIGTPQPSRAQRAAALYGAGRKYLRPGADPVRELIAERVQDDDTYPSSNMSYLLDSSFLNAVLVHRDPHLSSVQGGLLRQETLPEK